MRTRGGRLVVVATPIGNLGDLSPRAAQILREVDRVCCEDTRRTRALLSAAGIRGGARLISLHARNEGARVPELLGWLAEGQQLALVTDAGTPVVSDPGQQLIEAAVDAGIVVTTVPGPSAILAALVVSGLRGDRFCVEGFLPRRGTSRRRRLDQLTVEPRTAVVLEAPGRTAATLADLAASCPERRVAVARELTKVHEEVWRGKLAQAAAAFADREVRGEVVIVLEGAGVAVVPVDDGSLVASLDRRLRDGESPSHAAAQVAREMGVPRRHVYERAMELRDGTKRRAPGAP